MYSSTQDLYQISDHMVDLLTKKRKYKIMHITGKCPSYQFILSVEGACSFTYSYQEVIPTCSLLATHVVKLFSSFLHQTVLSLTELSLFLSLSLTILHEFHSVATQEKIYIKICRNAEKNPSNLCQTQEQAKFMHHHHVAAGLK